MTYEYGIEDEDVMMKLFVQSLEESAKEWYKSFLDSSIDLWDEYEDFFTTIWRKSEPKVCNP